MRDEGLCMRNGVSNATGGPTSPPPADLPASGSMSYEQRITRMKQAHANFLRSEAGFVKLAQILEGGLTPPWIKLSFPTKAVSGELVSVEVDLVAAVKKLANTSEMADKLLWQILKPLQDYLYTLYRDDLLQMASDASVAANDLLERETSPGGIGHAN